MTKLSAPLALALLSACSSSAEPVAQDLAHVKSDHGSFSASFAPHPNPPVTGQNALDIALGDAEGGVVTGAVIQIEPWMPGHGHGTPVVPVLTDLGAGNYHAAQIDFMMPGYWELTVDVSAGKVRDQFVVAYDVQ